MLFCTRDQGVLTFKKWFLYSPPLSKESYSALAQLVEQMTVNHWVAGSSPAGGAKQIKGRTSCGLFLFPAQRWARRAQLGETGVSSGPARRRANARGLPAEGRGSQTNKGSHIVRPFFVSGAALGLAVFCAKTAYTPLAAKSPVGSPPGRWCVAAHTDVRERRPVSSSTARRRANAAYMLRH